MPDTSGAITVFAPSPLVTVTIEDRGGEPDIHVHAGGQGVWQARMISSLGVPVVLCAALGGETGEVLRHLIAVEGVEPTLSRSMQATAVTSTIGERGNGRISSRLPAVHWIVTSWTHCTSAP